MNHIDVTAPKAHSITDGPKCNSDAVEASREKVPPRGGQVLYIYDDQWL